MLLNDFYTILKQEHTDDVSTATILLNESHTIFEGHFPGQPVVPGVCMLQMIRELMEVQTGKKLFIAEADSIKFLNVINPSDHTEIEAAINYSPQGHNVTIQATLFAGTITFFKLKAILKISDDTTR
jgi:3-hydroxyacyl-[acyl-carrier-protein] dehydratase